MGSGGSGARSPVGLQGSGLRFALVWVRVRRAAAAPIVRPPWYCSLVCFNFMGNKRRSPLFVRAWHGGSERCFLGQRRQGCSRCRGVPAASPVQVAAATGETQPPRKRGASRAEANPLLQKGLCPMDLASRCHQHWDGCWGVALHLAGHLSPSSRQRRASQALHAPAASAAASLGLETNACQDALHSPRRGLLVCSCQAIAAGKKTIAEVFLIRNEVGLAALNCLVQLTIMHILRLAILIISVFGAYKCVCACINFALCIYIF